MGPECVKPFQWKDMLVPDVTRPVRETPESLIGTALKLQVMSIDDISWTGPSTGTAPILRLMDGASALKSGVATGR